jgi:hypothetical protein
VPFFDFPASAAFLFRSDIAFAVGFIDFLRRDVYFGETLNQ